MEAQYGAYVPGVQAWLWFMMRMVEAGGVMLGIAVILGIAQSVFNRWAEKKVGGGYESR